MVVGNTKSLPAQFQIIQDNKTIDITQNSFGIRSLKFSSENGFQSKWKNGEAERRLCTS